MSDVVGDAAGLRRDAYAMSHAAAEACTQRLAAGRGTDIGLQHVNDNQSAQRDNPLDGPRGKVPSSH